MVGRPKNVHEEGDICWSLISLRIPDEFVRRIDVEKKSKIGLSRNGWILEAIQDRFKKEKEPSIREES